MKKSFKDIANGLEHSFISFRSHGTAGDFPDWKEACPICNDNFWIGMHGINVFTYGSNPPPAIEIGNDMRFFCSQGCYKKAIAQLLEILSKHDNNYGELECPWGGVSKSLNPWEHSCNSLKTKGRKNGTTI